MSDNTEKTYIEAFPISISTDLNDKLLTEKNITNIIKHICGRNSFIIGEVIENGPDGAKTYIEFILDGYYFKIEKPITETGTSYAYITYDNDTFNSLTITNTIPDNEIVKSSLQLLSGGNIKEDNKIRFASNLIELPTIRSIRCQWQESNS